MTDILKVLRSPSVVFYSYETDNGRLFEMAADRIEELEKQLNSATAAALESMQANLNLLDNIRDRDKEIAELRRFADANARVISPSTSVNIVTVDAHGNPPTYT
jgi:tRNA G26 N,N-dimethylase Trm1